MIFKKLAILLICSFGTIIQVLSSDITYSVITSLTEPGMSVKVIVDDKSYPLRSDANSILFKGKAPVARSRAGYHYAIYKNNQVSISESFSRDSVSKNTVNEFFNRSKNTHELSPLPQVLPPLPVIKRINSGLHNEGQIPTIHLWGDQNEIDKLHNGQGQNIKIKLNMDYIGLHDVYNFEKVKVELSGRSSAKLEKLSYTIKLKKKDDSHLYGYKNFKLRALAFDSSYIHEHIAFSCIKSAGIPSTGYSYARLFINNRPIGLFGFIETFQDPWVANEFANGDKNYQSGNLYQGIFISKSEVNITSNLKYLGENLAAYNLGEYKIKAGMDEKDTPEVFTSLKDFTKFVHQTTAETSIKTWEKHLDTEGFIRSMALEDLLGFSDGYMTTSDNYYLYDDPEMPGRMIYIPSDLDTTIGKSIFYIDLMLSGDYSKHPGFNFQPLTIKFFSNPKILQKYKDTILKLAKELIHPSITTPRIDSVVNMIRADVEWDRSLKRVGKNHLAELTEQASLTNLFAPGVNKNVSELFVVYSFDQSINGPINSKARESVKGFINRKVENVLKFYNQSK